jgi:hypothetical protein
MEHMGYQTLGFGWQNLRLVASDPADLERLITW